MESSKENVRDVIVEKDSLVPKECNEKTQNVSVEKTKNLITKKALVLVKKLSENHPLLTKKQSIRLPIEENVSKDDIEKESTNKNSSEISKLLTENDSDQNTQNKKDEV